MNPNNATAPYAWYNPITGNLVASNRATPSWYNPTTLAYTKYKWEVELGLQRRDRHFLIQEKRLIQNMINIWKKSLKGPYASDTDPEDIEKFKYDLLVINKELESLCD